MKSKSKIHVHEAESKSQDKDRTECRKGTCCEACEKEKAVLVAKIIQMNIDELLNLDLEF